MAMTFDELTGAKAVVEIDDVHHAKTFMIETMNLDPAVRIMRVAELLAALRDHYVEIGCAMEANAFAAKNGA